MAEKVFKSLQEFSDAYKTKRGTAFKADLSGFVAKDAEIHQAGAKWVVKTFTNLSGSVDEINKRLGTSFVEDEQYHTVPANIQIFVFSKEEADALAAQLKKGAHVLMRVTVEFHEYNDKQYIDLTFAAPFIQESKDGVAAPTAKKASAAAAKDVADASKDEDIPL